MTFMQWLSAIARAILMARSISTSRAAVNVEHTWELTLHSGACLLTRYQIGNEVVGSLPKLLHDHARISLGGSESDGFPSNVAISMTRYAFHSFLPKHFRLDSSKWEQWVPGLAWYEQVMTSGFRQLLASYLIGQQCEVHEKAIRAALMSL